MVPSSSTSCWRWLMAHWCTCMPAKMSISRVSNTHDAAVLSTAPLCWTCLQRCLTHISLSPCLRQLLTLIPFFPGIGLTNFIFAFPAYYLIDKRGRRWLLLVTLPFLAITMLATALSFKISPKSNAHAPIIGFFTYSFMFFYSWGTSKFPYVEDIR